MEMIIIFIVFICHVIVCSGLRTPSTVLEARESIDVFPSDNPYGLTADEGPPPQLKNATTAASLRRRSGSASNFSAAKELFERGQKDSALVSAGIPPGIVNHWCVRACRVSLSMWGGFVRTLTVTDSILGVLLRAGIAFGVLVSILFAVISVLCVVQRNGDYYLKLLNYHLLDNGTIKFDHIVSNFTLHPWSEQSRFNRAPPVYAGCAMTWDRGRNYDRLSPIYSGLSSEYVGLTIIDLALLSEIAYYDDDSTDFQESQAILNDMFPGLGMRVVSAPRLKTQGQ